LILGGAMFIPCSIAAAISGILTGIGCLVAIGDRYTEAFLLCVLLGGLMTMLFTFFAWMGYAIVKQGKVLAQTPYVPPFKADSLPAEEVLVRGSEQPPAVLSEVLLRAATDIETPNRELLRVTTE